MTTVSVSTGLVTIQDVKKRGRWTLVGPKDARLSRIDFEIPWPRPTLLVKAVSQRARSSNQVLKANFLQSL